MVEKARLELQANPCLYAPGMSVESTAAIELWLYNKLLFERFNG